MENIEKEKNSWFYNVAAVSAILFICLIVLDIVASVMAGKAQAPGSLGAGEVFDLFRKQPMRAFQYLGMINILEQGLMYMIVFAFYLSHKPLYKTAATLTLLLFTISLAIYIANNSAMPLYSLSQKYAAASLLEKPFLLAAGESLLSKGEDFTPGALPGFLLNELAVFIMLFTMLKANLFSKASSITGLAGITLLTIFTIAVTLKPELFNPLMGMSMVGGLLMLGWYVMAAGRLFGMGKGK